MSMFGKLIKNVVVNTAVGTFNLAKAANDAIQDEIDKAKLQELDRREEEFSKSISHYTKEEQETMRETAKRMAMIDLAKGFAHDQNNRYRLKFKMNQKPAVENKK